MHDKPNLRAWLLLVLLSLIWGSSFILIKKSLVVLTPLEIGSLRMLSASLVLLPIALSRLKHVSLIQIKYMIPVGLSGSFIPAFLFAIAQTHLASSITGIFNALTPLFTVLVGVTLFAQKEKAKVFIGVFIGLIGAIILIASTSGSDLNQFNYYALFVVLATILYAINSNLIKFKLHGLKAVTITSISMLIVGPFSMLILVFFTDYFQKFGVEGIGLATFYMSLLGIIGTAVALIIFNKLVQLTSPLFTSSVTYLIPIVAITWGVLDGETIVLSHLIGMLFILIGISISNRQKKAGTPA